MTSPTRTTKITNSGPRKSAGRPATGCDPAVKVRMPPDVMAAIDRFAGKFADLDRSAAIRALVELGLRAGRKKNQVYDPKGYRHFDRKVPLTKRRPRPPAARPPLLRVVTPE
jgi:hypothetical protein